MLRIRSHLLLAVRAASTLPCAASLRRPLYSSTPTGQFVVEDYLTTSCGLTPEQALNASRYLTRLKSPDNPDAVRAFLAGIGVSKADVTAALTRDPLVLCCKVDKTITPRIAKLRDMGLSPSQISNLIAINPNILRSHCMIHRLSFYLSLLGSYEAVLSAIQKYRYLLAQNVERVVKPNTAFLQQCGLTVSDTVKLFSLAPRMLMLEPERVKEIVVCADMLGVPSNSAMFKYALAAVYSVGPGKITARSDFLKKALGCSEAELGIAVRKFPGVLIFSEDRMCRVVDFLKMEVGLESNYIVRRPALLKYSLTKRLQPRHYVIKALKAKGLVVENVDFFTTVCYPEKRFIKRFLDPYMESITGVADAYASACAGQAPPVIQP